MEEFHFVLCVYFVDLNLQCVSKGIGITLVRLVHFQDFRYPFFIHTHIFTVDTRRCDGFMKYDGWDGLSYRDIVAYTPVCYATITTQAKI